MSEKEKKILETFGKVIPDLSEMEKEKLLSFGEGMSGGCVNKLLASFLIDTVTPRGMSYSKVIISIGRYRKCGEAWYFNEFEIQSFY